MTVTLCVAAPGTAIAALGPADTVQGLCDALVSSMKGGADLGFAGRRQLLEPEIRKALDLPLMTRLVVGPPWKGIAPEQQHLLVAAFADYSIANYASQFSGFSGERFTVDVATTRMENGDVIVRTRLFTKDPEPVRLDYLVRQTEGMWKIIDVFLNGNISQLAARRSEYSALVREGGAAALVEMLRKKTAELSG